LRDQKEIVPVESRKEKEREREKERENTQFPAALNVTRACRQFACNRRDRSEYPAVQYEEKIVF